MEYRLGYSERALKDLGLLDPVQADRIISKLDAIVILANPLTLAKRLSGKLHGQYRFRVGDYRIIFDLDPQGTIVILFVLRIRHRREAYE